MSAALLAALAAWCAVPPSARPRARRVLLAPAVSRRAEPAVVAAALVPVAAVVVLGPAWGIVVGLVLVPLTYRAVGRLESTAARRRAARIEADLPGALDLVVAALLVGRPPVTAFALAAEATREPLGAELAVVAGRLALAADPETVWRTMAHDPGLAPVGRAFRRAMASGMPVAEIVRGVADELRRERAARQRERSQRVGVRTAAPLGLCFLPAFFLIGIVPTIVATFSSLSW
ncbi:type II secretion system F family protein [Aeromicrobium wangtongii]|uniref:type II secretion system F family protein n=1 Tax=Aeromicrobium wangtongii TaxID=2969247 RepID=UPI00201785C6|nr:type II secretion system F family protein [Aeromicrobium wangtongii]MCL3817391.1 type II secretion system F family protein [Aeromicrobium wangtongii]